MTHKRECLQNAYDIKIMTRKRKYLYNAYNEKKKCLADSVKKGKNYFMVSSFL